jgi:hypothetical protein
MITGVNGHLVSEFFLERQLGEEMVSPASTTARRNLTEWRKRCHSLGPASSLRALLETGAEPLLHLLGFAAVEGVEHVNGLAAATLVGGVRPVALVVTSWGEPLDRLWRPAVVEAKRRAAGWCLLFNGTHIRLLEACRVYSRRYVEVDVDIAADDDRTAAALWTLFRVDSPLAELVTASERHGAGVCRSLRDGVLGASEDVLGALVAGPKRSGLRTSGESALHETFEQALTIVYRILFLLFAEARGLVPVWHPVYRESYSVDALRASLERIPSSPGVWDALRAVSRLAHSGCRAGDLHVTAFNGRLFAPARTPLAERRNLDDGAARRAVLALATRPAPDGDGREPIAYRDLGVEQLGAVYETLLDYEPRIATTPEVGVGRVTLERGSGLRKATGTFYTPQPIAQYLVRRTLGPLVDEASPERILELKVVDPAMGSGAFLVAACEYLAHAYETALIRAGGCHPADLGPSEHAAIRRTIAERCLYGVDVNPMAVQLARLSLWLTTLAADHPLTFLDHHLQAGDSLLGAWLACLGHMPARRRRKPQPASLPFFDAPALGDALRQALPVRFTLASAPGNTLEQVREKERALASLTRRDNALSKWKRVADVWCARWFWTCPERSRGTETPLPPAAFGALSDAILAGKSALPEGTADRYLRACEGIAASRRFFHWELECPEVFFDAHGTRLAAPGFDAVLGNPPWDMIRADSGSAADRSQARSDAGAVVRFTRDAGVYSAQSDGHANRYQLFLERAIALTRPSGRIGLVLPSGFAADHGSARLRRLLFSRTAVDAIVGLDNRRGVFPIHRSVRFLLVTATAGAPTREVGCRLGERNPAVLETGDDQGSEGWFPVRITPATLERLTGEDLALPELASPIDLAIAERAASLFPPLGDERGWAARFGRELNATDDRRHFQPPGRGLPVVEGKQIQPFHVDVGAARSSISRSAADRLLGVRHRQRRLGYRDVASASNKLTLIAALLPPDTVSTHTVFCLRTAVSLRAQQFLCGLFNSFVLNYLVRLRVTTHVTTAIVERLPVPRLQDSPAPSREIAALAALLARRGPRQSGGNGGQTPFPPDLAFARLNARVAKLYQLTVEEFEHVLSTFPLVPREDREAALREFRRP